VTAALIDSRSKFVLIPAERLREGSSLLPLFCLGYLSLRCCKLILVAQVIATNGNTSVKLSFSDRLPIRLSIVRPVELVFGLRLRVQFFLARIDEIDRNKLDIRLDACLLVRRFDEKFVPPLRPVIVIAPGFLLPALGIDVIASVSRRISPGISIIPVVFSLVDEFDKTC
jgi:hypothetical protein